MLKACGKGPNATCRYTNNSELYSWLSAEVNINMEVVKWYFAMTNIFVFLSSSSYFRIRLSSFPTAVAYITPSCRFLGCKKVEWS